MTIHVNIGQAKTRLSELVAAAVKGEEVILARAGQPQVRLVPTTEAAAAGLRETAERRRSAIGMWREEFAGFDTSIAALKADHSDSDERFSGKFGLPD